MAEKKATIRCPRCRGKGEITVTGHAVDAAYTVRIYPGHNGAELARFINIKPTAMNNRLVAAEKLKLIRRKQHGREVLWFAR